VATDRDRAEHVLGVTRIDLLVSDVRRGPDREVGLADLRGRRESERCPGPAVLSAGRTTPNREARAGALDARGATRGALLFRRAEEALERAAF
jgi:hypothetical protein